jgi:hypothetical protein
MKIDSEREKVAAKSDVMEAVQAQPADRARETAKKNTVRWKKSQSGIFFLRSRGWTVLHLKLSTCFVFD